MKYNFKKKNILGSFSFRLFRIKRRFAIAAACVAAMGVFACLYILLPVDSKNRNPALFRVEKGEGSSQIASNLKQAGFIRSSTGFTLYAFLTGNAFKLKDGEYLFAPSMSAHTILGKLAAGDSVQQTITIQEGWNLRTIAEAFEKRGLFRQEEFFAVTGYPAVDYREKTILPRPKNFSGEFAFLRSKPSYVSLEGYLFPDTYQITANETPESFVRRALKNFENNLTPEILAETQAQGKTLFETITFAALIEKEVRGLEDKKLVAGVLQKRMENGMRLQADAAVVYIRDGNYYRVSIAETQIESPYNTYRVEGLPLGPISNPGLESIRAVLEPKDSPYWFYLSARDGTTIFSETFEQHLAAKDLYLR